MHFIQEHIFISADVLSFSMYILFAICLCAIILLSSFFLGEKSHSRYKNTPFESGIVSCGDTKLRFSVHFYLIGMFFLIFDVESLYLYAWSVSIKQTGWLGFIEVLLFIFVLFVSLIYIVNMKCFDWSQRKLISLNHRSKARKN
ncbi:NAD(P)H-quinone oxidoreductase subunit 3 [Buchnera aphidicola (Hormaphis cornu)]|nr:NAD(P)H-quinone oxidoreductase subunit 3 [Buchnera aphidicola (Hormaphis cornu)]